MREIILYTTDDGVTKIDLHLENGTVWLTQLELAELFQTSKQNISKHVQSILADQELSETATVNQKLTVQHEGDRDVSRSVTVYNLDMILAVGCRVRSLRGIQFRQYASTVLKEYLEKGFALNDDRLKTLGGGNYWKELLDRIRDIRSSEKVMYRQVLDLYATASEVIYMRVDHDKPFAGLNNFKGDQPTQADVIIAKNYLNNLVSAYFDLAELNAIEKHEMHTTDYVRELDNILSSTGRKTLDNVGKISSDAAKEKAKLEYKKYKAKTLNNVGKEYLNSIASLEKQAKTESRKQ